MSMVRSARRIEVHAPVFGSLAMLHAENEAEVELGDRICEIEAMKTYFSVIAPAKGKLTWRLGLGEVIGTGEIIAWIVQTGKENPRGR